MSEMARQAAAPSARSSPNFSFPPKYINISSIQEVIPVEPTTFKTLPQFGFPIIRNPTPRPVDLPEIMTPLTPLETPFPSKRSPFLLIPLEIRLHIYSYVLLSHPIHHAHLAPTPSSGSSSHLTQQLHTTIFGPLGQSLPTTSLLTPTPTPQKISALHPISSPTIHGSRAAFEGRGKIPSGLLTCCRQVYEESKLIPWEQNSFSFINWFWSGVYAAKQFTRGLRDWQSASMRWVGVEVLGRDLFCDVKGSTSGMVSTWGVVAREGEGAKKGRSEWAELCSMWTGVWGLRLGVKGSVVFPQGGSEWVEQGGIWTQIDNKASEMDGILNVGRDWVRQGLMQLKRLRWLEIEIEDEDVTSVEKMRFCEQLENILSNAGERDVRVMLVERVKIVEKEVENKDFVWFGGEPGNDSIWGDDA